MEASLLVLFLFYLSLFIVGVIGNLLAVVSLLRSAPKQSPSSSLRLYILALSVVDLCCLSVIPALLLDHWIIGQWVLGRIACKYYWAMENVSKLLSIAILAILSLERYLTVRYPRRFGSFRSKQSTALVLVLFILFVVIALLPLLIFADVQRMTFTFEHAGLLRNVTVVKCAVDQGVSDLLQTTFIGYSFALGYCLPFCIIIIAYTKLILYVYATRSRAMRWAEEGRPTTSCRDHVWKSTVSVVRVTLFHLTCWTPYWLSMLLTIFVPLPPTPAITVAFMYLHALPFVSSAGNWIFYALLNRDLKLSLRNTRHGERDVIQIPMLERRTQYNATAENSLIHVA